MLTTEQPQKDFKAFLHAGKPKFVSLEGIFIETIRITQLLF